MVARKQSGPKANRGAVQKRRSALRADKDGDLSMEASAKGRGGISKNRTPTGPAGEGAPRKPRNALTAGRLKAEVMRHVSSGTAAARGASAATLDEIAITGWKDAKSTATEDSIVTNLVTWLEKKATLKSPTKRPVRVRKVCQQPSTASTSNRIVKAGPPLFAVIRATPSATLRPDILSHA